MNSAVPEDFCFAFVHDGRSRLPRLEKRALLQKKFTPCDDEPVVAF
jgi:hypothetical protein